MTTTHNFTPGTRLKTKWDAWFTVAAEIARKPFWPDTAIPIYLANDMTRGTSYLLPHDIQEVHVPDVSPQPTTLKNFGKHVAGGSEDWNEALLRLACDHGRQVEFEYTHLTGGRPSTRIVGPEEVLLTSAGNKLLVGYDANEQDYRSFRLDHIQGDVDLA